MHRFAWTVVTVATIAFVNGTTLGASFQRLGDLPGGDFLSRAFDLSDDGQVVVGISSSNAGDEAFRWTATSGMVGLGDIVSGGSGQFDSTAYGTSANGDVVVGRGRYAATPFGPDEAFRWTAANGMVGLGDLSGGIIFSESHNTSADGTVVVGQGNSASGYEAFRWTEAGGMVGLGDLPGGTFFSEAFATSADGSVVVGMGRSAHAYEAFRWTESGGMVGLGSFPGPTASSQALDVSADGNVVVGSSIGISYREAFRWTEADGMVALGELPSGFSSSTATDVSANGEVIVGQIDVGLGNDAFIWDASNGRRLLQEVLVDDYGLDLTGWRLTQARGVSADGSTIAGIGINPDGIEESWIVTIPEPATLPLLMFGSLAVLIRNRRSLKTDW